MFIRVYYFVLQEQMMLIDELEKARNNAIRNNEIVEVYLIHNARLLFASITQYNFHLSTRI